MNSEYKITALEKEVENLKLLLHAEVARLTKWIRDCEEGVGYYIEQHGREHHRLIDMVYPAYTKTHPEYVATLIAAEKIIGKPSDDGSDPQP